MAFIREFSYTEPKRNQEHEDVHRCEYTTFTSNKGNCVFQLSSYGKGDRANPDKIGQSLQFDEQAARLLIGLLKETFPALRDH